MEQDINGQETCKHEDAVKWNPYNHVVQCHRCGQVFVPGSAATPADGIYAFAAWLTSRQQQSGPFSAHDDAAPMAELIKQFTDHNGWEVSRHYPDNFSMPTDKA